MFSWPCPEEVNICTELSGGLGRRLPCYSTNQHIIIVRKEISKISKMIRTKNTVRSMELGTYVKPA